MTRPKKFPIILLCFTLVFAIFISGITWPGFLLGLFKPQKVSVVGSGETFEGENGYIVGNSSPFRISADTGVTISAEANALDHDRTFNVSRIGYDLLRTFQDTAYKDDTIDFMPFMGWNIDAGMTADDIMPGTFHIDFDLSKLGFDELMYKDIAAYHVDENGVWNRYVTDLVGSVLSFDARQNEVTLLGSACYLASAAAIGWACAIINETQSGTTLSGSLDYEVYEYDEMVDSMTIEGGRTIPVVKRYGKPIFTIKFEDIVEDNKQLRIDIKIEENIAKEKSFKQAEEYIMNTYGRDRLVGYDGMADPNMNEMQILALLGQKQMEFYKQILDNNNNYKELVKHYNDNMASLGITIETIRRMADLLRQSYSYITKVAQIRELSYVPDIYMKPRYEQDGVTLTKYPTGRAYCVIKTAGIYTDKASDDKILITLAHELTHVCHTMYRIQTTQCLKYDEALGEIVQEDAYEWFQKHSFTYTINGPHGEDVDEIITDSPAITTSMDDEMGNGYEWQYFAYKMDGYESLTWQSSVKTSFSQYALDKSDRSDSGYPYARFILYLKEKCKPEITLDQLMDVYNTFWIKINPAPSLSSMLKAAFDINNDEKLTEYFNKFALDNKVKFYEYSRSNRSSPFLNMIGMPKKNGGRTNVAWSSMDYTIVMKDFKIFKPENYNKPLAALIVQDPGFQEVFSDLSLIPVGNTSPVKCKYGLFYPTQSYDALSKGALLEVNGGMSTNLPQVQVPSRSEAPNPEAVAAALKEQIDSIASGYSIWSLLAPDEIQPEVKDGQLKFKMPEMSEAAKAGYIDGYRVKITTVPQVTDVREEYMLIGIAGKERSINLDNLLPKELIQRAMEDENSDERITFKVSVCEYILDPDGTLHFGPDSNENSIDALLSEMGAHSGKLTITLHWYGTDDLDLHCTTPKGGHISYSNKEADGGYLDVDMNIRGDRTESVEHIYFTEPPLGEYSVYINNYTDRTEGNHTAEIYVTVQDNTIISDVASMGSSSKMWKFKIEPLGGTNEEGGAEYIVGSIINDPAPADSSG